MRPKKQRPSQAAPQHEPVAPAKPAWQAFLDPEERPNREDLAAQHDVFLDTMLEPVPLPRWLRGRGRQRRDRLS